VALLLLGIQACTFEEPTLPRWFTELRLPIPVEGKTMQEAVNDTVIIDTTDAGNPIIAISVRDSSDREKVSRDDLAIKPDDDRTSTTLGDVSLDSPGMEQSAPISAGDLVILVTGDSLREGVQVVIPPAMTVNLNSIFQTFGSFEFVVNVNTGSMSIDFINNTFLNFSAGTNISIYDSISGDFIGNALFSQPIDSNSFVQSDLVPLNGRTFSNHLRYDVELILAGQSHVPDASDLNGTFYFESTISEMTVSQASAEVPEQDFSRQDSSSLAEQDDRLITAIIDGGRFRLSIENTMNVEANVTVELLNFYEDPDYTTVKSLTYNLNPRSADDFDVVIDDLYVTDYNNGPTPGSEMEYVKYRFEGVTMPSVGMISITEDDSIVVALTVEDSVYVREFTGTLAPREFTFDPVEQNEILDAQQVEGSLLFQEMQMALNIYNQIGIGIDVDLNIVGYKNSRQDSILLLYNNQPINLQVAPRETDEPAVTSLTLDNSNSNIVEFIEFLPEDIVSKGKAFIEGEGTIRLSDEVWSDYHLYSPFYLEISNNTTFTSEIETLDLDEDIRERLLNGDITDVNISIDLENGLPIGAQLFIFLSSDSSNLISPVITDPSQKIVIDDIVFSPGVDTDTDNFVDVPFKTTLNDIVLIDDEIEALARANYIASQILLDDTNGLVKFRATDKIEANGFIRLRYRTPEIK
jgi:hypothetical protein